MSNGVSEIRIENRWSAYLVRLWITVVPVISATLLYPLCLWYKNVYFTSRTYIDGHKLKFNGHIFIMYVIYFIGLVVAGFMVTLLNLIIANINFELLNNIYVKISHFIPPFLVSFFVVAQERKYVQMQTHFEHIKNGKSGFKFRFFLLILKTVLCKGLTLISAGLLFPITSRLECLYDYKRGYIDGKEFNYHFSFRKMIRWLFDILLITITLGFYFPFAINRIEKNNQTFVHLK